MKKILLFFIAIFLTTNVVHADVSISLKVHAPNYESNNTIASTKIWTNEFLVENLSNNKKNYFNKSFSFFNGGITNSDFRIYESNSDSLGYYQNIPFDYTINLNSECPSISIDITKKLVEFNIEVEIKDQVKSKLQIFDYNGREIFYEKNYQGVYHFTGIYGYYNIYTDYGYQSFRPSLDSNENIIVFEDDYYKVSYQKIAIDEPYQPEVKIIKYCYNEFNEKYPIDIDYIIHTEKSDDNENYNETNSANPNPLRSSIPIEEEIESKEEITDNIIAINNDDNLTKEDIKTDEPINEITPSFINNILPLTSKTLKITSKKSQRLNKPTSKIVDEEPESNLIIEYQKPNKYQNLTYQKASNLPLFISLIITIIPLFVLKISKKVQKN